MRPCSWTSILLGVLSVVWITGCGNKVSKGERNDIARVLVGALQYSFAPSSGVATCSTDLQYTATSRTTCPISSGCSTSTEYAASCTVASAHSVTLNSVPFYIDSGSLSVGVQDLGSSEGGFTVVVKGPVRGGELHGDSLDCTVTARASLGSTITASDLAVDCKAKYSCTYREKEIRCEDLTDSFGSI